MLYGPYGVGIYFMKPRQPRQETVYLHNLRTILRFHVSCTAVGRYSYDERAIERCTFREGVAIKRYTFPDSSTINRGIPFPCPRAGARLLQGGVQKSKHGAIGLREEFLAKTPVMAASP